MKELFEAFSNPEVSQLVFAQVDAVIQNIKQSPFVPSLKEDLSKIAISLADISVAYDTQYIEKMELIVGKDNAVKLLEAHKSRNINIKT